MHEQSQTIERDGQYFNVSGVTGEDLEGPFPTLDVAVESAKRRSASFDNDPSLQDPRLADADLPDRPDAPGVSPSLDDLTTQPPSYWDDLHTGYENGTISSDDVYQQRRQRQHDLESPLLVMQREQDRQERVAAAEAAPKPPDERAPTGHMPPPPDDPLGQRSGAQFGTRPDTGMLRRDAEGNVEVTLETTQAAPPAPENLFPVGGTAQKPQGFIDALAPTQEDREIVRGLVRGPLKAVDSMGSLAADLAEKLTGLDLEHIKRASVANYAGGEPETFLGGQAQNIAQILTVALPVGRGIRIALAAGEAATALGAGEAVAQRTVGKKLLEWALTAEGADVASDFLAFDPNDPRLSNLYNEYFPGYANFVTNYLAATGHDSEWDGRLKNVLEGRIMNATLAASTFLTIKGLKVGRTLVRQAVDSMPQMDLGFVIDGAGRISDYVIPPQPHLMRNEAGSVPGPRGPRVPPLPPSLDKDLTYAEMGKGSSSWYHGVGNYVKGKLGRRDGNFFLDMMAIASQGQEAGRADLNIAIDAFNRFRSGQAPEDIVRELRIGNVTGPNIRAHLLALMTGTKLNDIFGVSELKVRDYRRALDGDPKVVVVDRWMWRTYYWDQWETAKAKHNAAEDARIASGEGPPKRRPFNGWQGGVAQYKMIQERVTQEATRLGMQPSDLQAQMWAGIKLAVEGQNATGLQPMRDMVKARFDRGEIKRIPGQTAADLIRSETAIQIAGIVAGIVAGHYAGDTDEEQATYALMAAGLTNRHARRVSKDIVNLLPAAASLRNTMVAEEGGLTRVYHGTNRTFEEYSPKHADPSALYGPGFYNTEDPVIAGGPSKAARMGYADPRDETRRYFDTQAEAEVFQKEVGGQIESWAAAPGAPPNPNFGPWFVNYRDPASTRAPQVRPAYLNIQRPFDADKVFTKAEVDEIGIRTGYDKDMPPEHVAAIKDEILRLNAEGARVASHPDHDRLVALYDSLPDPHDTLWGGVEREPTGKTIYHFLDENHYNQNKAWTNRGLQDAGYDGITHIGGGITGNEPHRVWIAFKPEQVISPFEVEAQARMAKTISGGGPALVTPDDPASMAEQYAAAVIEARRGGPRTHPQVQAEAQGLINRGLASLDWIRSLVPGTTLADAPTTALVMQLAESGSKMRALTRQALQATDPAEQLAQAKAVVQQLWVHGQLDPKRIGVLTESGRTMSALTDPTSGLNRFLQQFELLMRDQNAPIDPMKVVRAINDFQDPGQLAVLAKQTQKPGFWQMFNEYYVNGLLWGPKTWMANFVGNAGATIWAVPERAIAARMGDERGVQAGEAIAMIEGLTNSIVSAWTLAADAFKKGESQFEKNYGTGFTAHGDKIDNAQRAISADTFQATGVAGQAIDAVGNLIRFPMRVLASTDDFFKVINYNMELSALASREARGNLQTTHFKTGKEYADAIEAEKARIMADPPLSVKKSAESFALYQTFTKELGPGGQLIQQWANTVPGGRIIAPIIRTPINIFKYAGERTPLALVTSSYWKAINGSDRAAADLAKSRVALGSMTMTVAAMMAYGGLITGKGPSDPATREKLEKVGWKPYSAKVGDTYIGINRLEPVGMLFTLAADYVDAVVNSDAETAAQWAGDAAWALSITTAKGFASHTFVQGVAETAAFMTNPERASEQFKSRFLQSLLPMSGLLRQGAVALDPTMREAEGVLQRVCAQTPGCSSTLPPQRTLLDAEPLWQTGAYGPIGISQGKRDREMNAIIELGVHVPEVPNQVEQNIALQPEEKDYWVVQRGTMEIGRKTLREKIAGLMDGPRWDSWNNEMRAQRIEEAVQEYHDKAKAAMFKKYDAIPLSIRDAEQQANAARRQGQGEPMPTSPLLRSLTR